jgi:glycerophosphoryl diester phosphodiesterase
MLMHDSTVNRTTTGTGNASSLTAAQIGALDNGSWFDDRYAGQRPPTLVQALTRLRGTGVKAYLDVKVSGMANEIRAAMQQAGVTEQDVWLWAYSSAAVAEYNSVFTRPQIVTGDTPSTLAGWQSLRVQNVVGVDLGFGTSQLSDPTFYANARAAGMWVSAYTVVDPRTMLTLINASVDRMETDYPALLNSLMRPACPADVNGDSSVDGDDVIAFSTGWDAGNYDFNGDGGTDGDDVIAFFGRWDAGC